MIEIFGAITGFASATIPNLFKLWQDKADKKHEIALLKLQIEKSETIHANRLQEIEMEAEAIETQAIYATYNTNIKWIDGFNGLVRPSLAYFFFFLYAYVKIVKTTFFGLPVHEIWTETDNLIFLTIISYFFGQRAMGKLIR